MGRGPARVGVLNSGAIEALLEPRRGTFGKRLVGPRPSGRRHRAGPKLANDLFQDLGVCAVFGHVQCVERESADLQSLVVTRDAVLVENRTRWCSGRLFLLQLRNPSLDVVVEGTSRAQHRDDEREATGSHRLTGTLPSGIAAALGG